MASPGPFDSERPRLRSWYKRRLRVYRWLCMAGAVLAFVLGGLALASEQGILAFLALIGGAVGIFFWDYYGRIIKSH